jgi:hypothetical protein
MSSPERRGTLIYNQNSQREIKDLKIKLSQKDKQIGDLIDKAQAARERLINT